MKPEPNRYTNWIEKAKLSRNTNPFSFLPTPSPTARPILEKSSTVSGQMVTDKQILVARIEPCVISRKP